MTPLQVSLRQASEPLEILGWLLRGHDARAWLDELYRWGAPLHELRLALDESEGRPLPMALTHKGVVIAAAETVLVDERGAIVVVSRAGITVFRTTANHVEALVTSDRLVRGDPIAVVPGRHIDEIAVVDGSGVVQLVQIR